MMKKQLTLSIVIPAYNEEGHLTACLESIAAQTVPPDEVIVVDNSSTDKTAEIAGRFAFVRVIREKRRGVVYARNRGFDAATADIIGRIDADSVLPANWVQHIKSFYAEPENQRSAWSGRGFFYSVRLPRLVSWAYQLMGFYFNRLLVGHYTLWGSNMAIRRSHWRMVRRAVCNRTDIHEDLDLALHIAQKGVAIVYDPSLPVGAELRRIHRDRRELWEYLQWWPQTLRAHGKKTWVVCWFFGAFLLYLATFVLVFVDWSERTLEKLLTPAVTERPKIAPQDFSRD